LISTSLRKRFGRRSRRLKAGKANQSAAEAADSPEQDDTNVRKSKRLAVIG
jgi:hypothetical protein